MEKMSNTFGKNVTTPSQKQAYQEMCRAMKIEEPAEFTIVPLSSPAVLVHWRVVGLIITLLEQHEREEFTPCLMMRKRPRRLNRRGKTINRRGKMMHRKL